MVVVEPETLDPTRFRTVARFLCTDRGLYIGAWSVANFAGQAIGNVISGLLYDMFFWLTGNPLMGYSAVFSLEIAGLLLAVWLFRSISVEEFRRQAEVRLHTVLSMASD